MKERIRAQAYGLGFDLVGITTLGPVEGAAALPVAAYLQEAKNYAGQNVAILLCGRNIPFKKLRSVLGN